MIKLRQSLIVMSLFTTGLLLQSCASQTDVTEQLALGKTYFKQENYPRAFATLEPVARAGNPDAEYAIGFMYYYGRGVTENRVMAKYWMSKAAQHGQASAQKALSKLKGQAVDETQVGMPRARGKRQQVEEQQAKDQTTTDQGSSDQGSSDQNQGSNDQGSNDQGSNAQGSSDQGNNSQESNAQAGTGRQS